MLRNLKESVSGDEGPGCFGGVPSATVEFPQSPGIRLPEKIPVLFY